MKACSAPWYELNISAPDDNASACCYYSGDKESFSQGAVDLSYYWNGPSMKKLRRLQSDPNPRANNGCSSCFFFQNIPNAQDSNYFDFDAPLPADISPLQRANWNMAKLEHAERREHVESAPMRLYANFGYTCNIACKMCHQVPRRQNIDRFITSDAIYAWRNDLPKMMEVCVIGGEPFAMPEAVKFMRRFAVDEAMDSVRLSIFTNGTVHHKHFDTLKQKRKLGICISLDSISQGYEAIRIGSKWETIERNILMIKEQMTANPTDWYLTTNAIIMKTGVPFLPEFARWHVEHDVSTRFLDFINYRGTEDAYFTENIISEPQLLDEIPGWREHFDYAIEIFEKGRHPAAAASLRHFRDKIVEAHEAAGGKQSARQIQLRNDWSVAVDLDSTQIGQDFYFYPGNATKADAFDPHDLPLRFTTTRPGDMVCLPWMSVETHSNSIYKLTVEWSLHDDLLIRHAHVILQSQHEDLNGFREFKRTQRSLIFIMTGILPSDVEQLRVAICPVGEDVSIFPQRITLDVDRSTVVRATLTDSMLALASTVCEEEPEPVQLSKSAVADRGSSSFFAFLAGHAKSIGRRMNNVIGR